MADLAQHFLGLPVFVCNYEDLCNLKEEESTLPTLSTDKLAPLFPSEEQPLLDIKPQHEPHTHSADHDVSKETILGRSNEVRTHAQ